MGKLRRYGLRALCLSTALVSAAPQAVLRAEEQPLASLLAIARGEDTQQATDYKFTSDEDQLLDQIERGCFNYLWNEVNPSSGLVKDRRFDDVCSLAGVGFQLTALPIGVQRGWITREQGYDRALQVLKTLASRADNRKFGVFLHYVDSESGGKLPGRLSEQASTVDHALFLAGALPAAAYFGAEVAKLVDEFVDATNWKAFDVSERGFISFGWRPDGDDMDGPGEFSTFDWHLASDEERLIYFIACGSPREDFAGEASDYYRLERNVKQHGEMAPQVVSWTGSMFTYYFAHLWIDYRSLTVDNPEKFGVNSSPVDWFENSRRATLTHRQRCVEAASKFATFADDRWGLAPCMGRNGDGNDTYLVPSLEPNVGNEEAWENGTVAPYAAGSSIMFAPAESMAALRAFRGLMAKSGEPLVWRDPSTGGYGFADSFNVDQQTASDDNVAIDVGPMLLAIENVRTGSVWKLFMQHPVARRAIDRLGLELRQTDVVAAVDEAIQEQPKEGPPPQAVEGPLSQVVTFKKSDGE